MDVDDDDAFLYGDEEEEDVKPGDLSGAPVQAQGALS
jgi:hypothetical protein